MKISTALHHITDHQYGVVIPIIDDNIRITERAIIDFAQSNPSVLISFILDETSKNTLPLLKRVQLKCPDNITVNAFKTLTDKVEAIRQGMLFMFQYTKVPNIGFLDPAIDISLESFLSLAKYKEHFPQFGIAIGSRIPHVNAQYAKIPSSPSKAFIDKLYAVYDKIMLKTNFQDIFCGAKLFNRTLIPFLFDSPFKDALLFEFELLLRLQKKFGKSSIKKGIVEFPIFKWSEYQNSPVAFNQFAILPINLFNLHYKYALSITINNAFEKFIKIFMLNNHFNYEKSLSLN
ncbi:MAG: hypothetical protein WCP74_05760 [Sphingobacteriia bacterium]|jgi:hypothetical protein